MSKKVKSQDSRVVQYVGIAVGAGLAGRLSHLIVPASSPSECVFDESKCEKVRCDAAPEQTSSSAATGSVPEFSCNDPASPSVEHDNGAGGDIVRSKGLDPIDADAVTIGSPWRRRERYVNTWPYAIFPGNPICFEGTHGQGYSWAMC